MKSTFILLLLFVVTNIYGQYKVVFSINKSSLINSGDSIFIAGNFNQWNPSSPRFKFTEDSAGLALYTILPKGEYKYKCAKGSWEKVETEANGNDIGDRILSLKNDTTIQITIAGWKDNFANNLHTASLQVMIMDTAFDIPQLNRKRKIWIYLPKDYNSAKKKYPVMYMHDGQNLFDKSTSSIGEEWGIDEYLDSVFSNGQRQCIIVGIENGNEKRINEYSPYDFDISPTQHIKPEGKEYVDFLAKTLKPYVDRRFRTLSGKQNTFIAGSSLGAVISLYAVLKYPKVFGGAGIFSPAFWSSPGLADDITHLNIKIKTKLFFYAGAKESNSMIPDMKKIESLLKKFSAVRSKEIINTGGIHNEIYWRKTFPSFYEWIIKNQ